MLSDNIRKYRKLNNLSQDELAEKLEVTRQSVSLWETGQTQPSLDKIVAMAKLFGISTDRLLTDEEEETVVQETVAAPVQKTKKTPAALIVVIILLSLGVLIASLIVFNSVFSIWGDSDTPTEAPAADIRELYSYLKDFVVQNGIINGDYCYYSKSADNYGGYADENFSLYYWGDTETVEFCLHSVINDTFSINFYLYIPKNPTGTYEYVSSYYYRDTGEPLKEARGTIVAGDFTKNYPLNCSKYIGDTSKQNDFMEESRIGVCDLLDCLKQFLAVEKLAYSFKDLGFTKFK